LDQRYRGDDWFLASFLRGGRMAPVKMQ
jgi:hypothetical protein